VRRVHRRCIARVALLERRRCSARAGSRWRHHASIPAPRIWKKRPAWEAGLSLPAARATRPFL